MFDTGPHRTNIVKNGGGKKQLVRRGRSSFTWVHYLCTSTDRPENFCWSSSQRSSENPVIGGDNEHICRGRREGWADGEYRDWIRYSIASSRLQVGMQVDMEHVHTSWDALHLVIRVQ